MARILCNHAWKKLICLSNPFHLQHFSYFLDKIYLIYLPELKKIYAFGLVIIIHIKPFIWKLNFIGILSKKNVYSF